MQANTVTAKEYKEAREKWLKEKAESNEKAQKRISEPREINNAHQNFLSKRRRFFWDFKGNNMKKYVFMRILRSLVSIFLVTTLIYTIIYTMVPRKLIFKQDTNYNKIATTADKRDNYENTVL